MTGHQKTISLIVSAAGLYEICAELIEPLQPEEHPVVFEHQEYVEPPRLIAPTGPAWENPHERIGRR
jgi:hypothetical protein